MEHDVLIIDDVKKLAFLSTLFSGISTPRIASGVDSIVLILLETRKN